MKRTTLCSFLLSMLCVTTAWADNNFTVSADGNTYTIKNEVGWAQFCAALKDNATYNRFSGKTVKLGANITVTSMAGSSNHDFCGTFDGDGKTLTFNYGSSTAPTTEEYVAPFRYVSNATPVGGTEDSPATFKNLNVAGTIYTSAKYAAGIVSREWGVVNIENCHVSTTINSTVEGDGTHGGIVSYRSKGSTDIYHTLFAPTALTIGTTNSATFVRNATSSCNEGCYYTQPFNDGTNNLTSQGSIAVLVGSEKPANTGTAGTNYGMVQAYANGLKYNNKYYVGSDNNLTVNATGTAYTIGTSTGWNLFCAVLASNAQGFFTGKTVTLGASITASTMAGDSNHKFSGTFEGGGKRLTLSVTAADNYAAPFRYVDGASDDHTVIRNLNVSTTIKANDYRHIAGLVANLTGCLDVTGCNVTVDINSTKGTNTPTNLYPAGLVSQVSSGAQLAVSGSTVGGTINTDGKYAGGFIGIVQGSASIVNSVCSVTIDSSVSGDGTHGGFVGGQSGTGSSLSMAASSMAVCSARRPTRAAAS